MKKLILIALLIPQLVLAYDISLEPLISEIPQGGIITHIFKIENLEHETGMHNSILVNLSYNVSFENTTITGSSQHIINKYTTATPNVEVGNVTSITLCGTLSANVSETNFTNNQGCWSLYSQGFEPEIVVNETPIINETIHINDSVEFNDTNSINETDDILINETEEIIINETEDIDEDMNCTNISITQLPALSNNGEQLSYYFEEWKSGDVVTYWIEDLFGKIIKSKVTTTSGSKRTYTPRVQTSLEVLVILAERQREGCELSSAKELVIILGEETEEEETQAYEDEISITSEETSARGGESFTLQLDITKSDNRLRVISVTFLGETYKIRLKQQGEYEVELPLNIIRSCVEEDVEENILIEGLGEKINYPLTIVQKKCEEEKTTQEEFIKSLYVRAQKYQEEILLYGNTLGGEVIIVSGTIASAQLDEGSFSLPITPKAGNNTLFVLKEVEGNYEGEKLDFYLEGGKEEKTTLNTQGTQPPLYSQQKTEDTDNTTVNPEFSATHTIPVPSGLVVAKEESTKANYYLIGAIGLVILVVGLFKGKHLRRKNHHAQ